MAIDRYDENRPATCAACGAKNVIRIIEGFGPEREKWEVECRQCGARLGPTEKVAFLVVELEAPEAVAAVRHAASGDKRSKAPGRGVGKAVRRPPGI